MKIFNFIKGRQGENLAQEYLEKNGYKIIQKNYRTKFAEIDIIAKKDNILSFIEVFLSTTDVSYDGISFDIIEIFFYSKSINHIKSAF